MFHNAQVYLPKLYVCTCVGVRLAFHVTVLLLSSQVGYAVTTYQEGKEEGPGVDERIPVIGFDMGGTSTDVSRYDGEYEHVFESTIAGVTIQAPQACSLFGVVRQSDTVYIQSINQYFYMTLYIKLTGPCILNLCQEKKIFIC